MSDYNYTEEQAKLLAVHILRARAKHYPTEPIDMLIFTFSPDDIEDIAVEPRTTWTDERRDECIREGRDYICIDTRYYPDWLRKAPLWQRVARELGVSGWGAVD